MNILRLALFITCFGLIFSCKPKQKATDHLKEVKYYTTLRKIKIKANTFIDGGTGDISQIFLHRLRNERIDSTDKNYYIKTIKRSLIGIDSCIKSVETMDEVDTALNIKQNMLSFYNETHIYIDTNLPIVLRVTDTWQEEPTKEESDKYLKMDYGSYRVREQISSNEATIDNLLFDFVDKHHLTDWEIGVNSK